MAAEVLAELPFAAARRFQVVRGNLLEEPVEAIFNAANGHLAHGGGVAALIARAAGAALVEESERLVRERGPIATGGAAVTGAGRLPFKGVIHVVGPRQGEGDEQAKLARALEAGFRCAEQAAWNSVAFPAVSSGIFAVPLAVCARAYVAAARGWLGAEGARAPSLIRLCLRDAPVIESVLAELARRE